MGSSQALIVKGVGPALDRGRALSDLIMRLTPLLFLFFALLPPGMLPARAVEVPISPAPGTTPGPVYEVKVWVR
jgi:hypothetical protein